MLNRYSVIPNQSRDERADSPDLDCLTIDSDGTDSPNLSARARSDSLLVLLRVALVSDVASIAVAVFVAGWARFSVFAEGETADSRYGYVSIAIATVWLASLSFAGAYDRRFLGAGWEEFRRVIVATFSVFGVIATTSFLLAAQVSRGFILIALPVGVVTLMCGRALTRRWFQRRRLQGDFLARTLVIGPEPLAQDLAQLLRSDPLAGFDVVDVTICPPTSDGEGLNLWLDAIERRIHDQQIQAVALTQTDRITNEMVRLLAWRLEGPRVDLLVAPSLGDVAGPRLTIRPAAGLPLIHLDEPALTGSRRLAKRALDIIGALVLLLIVSPLLIVVAFLVAVTSRGPVFYLQGRVGQHGKPFILLKFRSMLLTTDDDADDWQPNLADGPVRKSRENPRVTAVGRVMRRWSIDELPQLFNVVGSTMSLVGPRPLLLTEADDLPKKEQRRHLTKPGLTGLWQISGRKETTWDERMRLDLHYVENWSPALDAVILIKTVRAVVTGHGAY